MRHLILIILILIGIVNSTSAQDFFETNLPVEKTEKTLYFKFENISFFKNNEYESSFVDGYTLTGAWLRPKIIYNPSSKVQLELGWHYLKYNGADKSTWSNPWFSALINFTDNFQFIIGNLNNSQNHRLISPIWEPERFLTDKPEAGFQLLHNSDKLFFNSWLNWEQFIKKGDPFQEHLTSGISLEYKIFKSEKITFSVPLQILIHHRGGEIDTSPLKVQTLANAVYGLKSKIPLIGFFQKMNLAGYYVTFADSKGNAGLPFEKGNGWFLEGSVKSQIGNFGLSYLNAENFFGIKGKHLLQEVPGLNSEFENITPRKKMFSIYYDLKKEFANGVVFGTKLEGWFEPELDNFSNSAAIYLIINQDFLLTQF
ncbi:MAG: hypothetical protein HQ541_07995 [Mariniphaga sp.]|nr:hypothetical protein [Mariniphaga sp.]